MLRKNTIEKWIIPNLTINTRFTVARRSVFQLLYDKVDDWVNPKVK